MNMVVSVASVPGGRESAWLTYEREGKTVRVDLQAPKVVIGRSRSCDLVLRLRGISRIHCTAEQADDGWVLCDNDSSNGTFVNGDRIQRKSLSDGDNISFGSEGVVPLTVTFRETPRGQRAAAPEPASSEAGNSGQVAFEDEVPGGEPNVSVALGIEDLARKGDARPAPPNDGPVAEEPGVMRSLEEDSSPPDEPAGPDSWQGRPAVRHSGQAPGMAALVGLFANMAEALRNSATCDELLNTVLDLIFQAVPAGRGSVWLYDETARAVSPRALRNEAGPDDQPAFINRSIVNAAYKAKKSLLVHNADRDERFRPPVGVPHAAGIEGTNVRSAMCAPMFHQDRFLGFIYIESRSNETTFTEGNLELLTLLAQFAVTGIARWQPTEPPAESR